MDLFPSSTIGLRQPGQIGGVGEVLGPESCSDMAILAMSSFQPSRFLSHAFLFVRPHQPIVRHLGQVVANLLIGTVFRKLPQSFGFITAELSFAPFHRSLSASRLYACGLKKFRISGTMIRHSSAR
jgi:hypothetical protein